MTQQNPTLTVDSSAVMKHLDMNQGIINRMSANSAECKKWTVALVSAILVVVFEKGKVDYTLVALIPVATFFFIDAYYLALERFFIEEQKGFVSKLHTQTLKAEELYVVKGPRALPPEFLSAFTSWSTWPFYCILTVIIVLSMLI